MEMRKIDLTTTSLPELVKKGEEFHGHLGPFLVVGIKMGLLALDKLQSTGFFDLKAEVATGSTPPISCMVDGIQLSTGCTLGKGNISVTEQGEPRAQFSKDGKVLTIELDPEIFTSISEGEPISLARRIIELEREELFTWEFQ